MLIGRRRSLASMGAHGSPRRMAARAAFALVSAVALTQCSSQTVERSTGSTAERSTGSAATSDEATFTPVLSIRELMTHIIDPTADLIFDAAVVDVSSSGTTTTAPVSDDDWLKVERGILTLAEASNLLKMPRPVAPAGAKEEPADPGKPPPELPPAEIQGMIDRDRARWNQHADALRTVALASMALVKGRDPEALFKVGGDLDNACEACHLEVPVPRRQTTGGKESQQYGDPAEEVGGPAGLKTRLFQNRSP